MKRRIILPALLLVLAGGCRTAPPGPTVVEPVTVTTTVPLATADRDSTQPVFGGAVTGGSMQADSAEAESRSEVYEGTGKLINSKALGRNRQRPPAEDGELVFNFEGHSLQEVVKVVLGDVLNENYVIAPGVGGEVTFSTAKPVRTDQALPILEMLLSWNNASLVYLDGRYNVLPKVDAIKGHLTPTTAPLNSQRGYQVRVYPLNYIAPTEMEKLLQPYLRDGAVINADNSRNLLTIAGTRDEHNNYAQTIEVFDVDWLEGMSIGIYPLERVEVATVITELEAVFGEASGTPLAGMFRFLPIERLNAVLVITPQPEYLTKASDWVARLDRGGSEAGARLYVYAVRNVKAIDLADTLNDVFGGGGNNSNRRERQSGQLAPGLQAGEINSINSRRNRDTNQQDNNAQATPARRSGQAGVSLIDGEDIAITAVEESNSLLIRSSPGQYDSVLAAIKRLDIEPLQVQIEVQVLEVSLNDELNYGVQWFLEQALNDGFEFGGTGDTVPGPEPTRSRNGIFSAGEVINPFRYITSAGTGLAYRIRNGDTAAFVNLLESKTEVRSISAPSLMVLNNREATINVGEQIPVNSVIFNPNGGVGNNQQSRVQFRDTGTTLSVVPRINPGGMVFLEIDQEVSTPGAPDINGNRSVNRRQIATEIAVQSGETIVLGGLIQAFADSGTSGVPVLHRLPFIGGLFGSKTNSQSRSELLLLISPTVAENSAQARRISDEYRRKLIGLEPFDLEQVRINNKTKY